MVLKKFEFNKLCQIQTLSRPTLSKSFSQELGNVKWLILYGHQPGKYNLVDNNQQKYKTVFLNSSSIIRARHLQEVYCRFEIRRMLRAAKGERHLVRFFNDCSSLSETWDPIIAGFFEKKFLRFKTRKMKEAICFLLTLLSMGEWSHSCCDVGNCQY